MADKVVPLSIVLRTVDKATAGIQAVNKHLDALTKPTREFGKALSDLAEKSGMNRVGEAFGRVGSAATDLIGKVAMVGGVLAGFVGGAVAGMMHLVDQFAELGHVAARAGVEVDFLAGLRFAASKAGVPIEQLDEAVKTLTQNLGQAKTGTGRMVKFLEMASPALLHQLVHTNSTAEAVGLLADAMAKIPDAARRAALAQKTFGDAGVVLVLKNGSKAIQEQMAAYAKLAGAQEDAVKGALGVEDAMKDLNAATDGVKAVLVTGLAPALKTIIERLTAWLVGHRDDVAKWAADLGEKAPRAVEQLVTWVGRAYDKVTTFVEGIGGWKVALEGVVAVMVGPLALAIAGLGVALLGTPFGQVLLALTPIVAMIAKLVSQTEAFRDLAESLGFSPKKKTPEQTFASDMDAMMESGRRAAQAEAAARAALDASPAVQQARLLQDQRDAMLAIPGDDPGARARALNVKFFGEKATREAEERARAQFDQPQQAKITIEIKGAPKGTRATIEPGNTAAVDMTVGHQIAGSW